MTPALVRAFWGRAPLHAVNFHHTPARRADEYDRQFATLARHFEAATEGSLAAFLATGRWPHGRPGVVLAFYNGYRDNFDVARPLLERHGLRGWFFVVTGFAGCLEADQPAFAAAHGLGEGEGRMAMSWDELRALDRNGHVVASHTRTHSRLSMADPARLGDEIMGSQADLTRELGHPVRAFAGLGGEAHGENPAADALLIRAGYEFLFSNLRVQRLRP